MGVQKTRLSRLEDSERAQLEEALRDPERFHSDGREVTLFVIGVSLFLLIPLWALLDMALRSGYDRVDLYPSLLAQLADFPLGWRMIVHDRIELLGALAILAVQAALITYGVRTHGRHGHVIAPFGVVRIRGTALRLLRYRDIAEVSVIERGPPQHQIITTELELKARDGSMMSLYGFLVTKFKRTIEAAMAAARNS